MKNLFILLIILFAQINSEAKEYTYVVAQDGSGDFTTVQEAVTACGAFSAVRKTIYIKNGVYCEKVLIDSFHKNITLLGESREKTVITFDDHVGKGDVGTFTSYTVKVLGNNIHLTNLTVENTSGEVGQAVALHVEGDYCIVTDCNIKGDQDTLYSAGYRSRQYYKNCFISGTTDFIFGAATAVFDSCTLHSKRNSYITAANTEQSKIFGYVFRNCKLTAEPDVDEVYLGRPWRDYANVVFIDCEMGAHILPQGWHNWGREYREKTAFYAEYNSTGAGANPEARVKWSKQLNAGEAARYTFENIFGNCTAWNPVLDKE